MNNEYYPVGTPGKKWTQAERNQWLSLQQVKRSYNEEVLAKLKSLNDEFELSHYGDLTAVGTQYPLYLVVNKHWQPNKPTILVTGGVHGYETSGVQGAIRFVETKAHDYLAHFNIIVAPCVSPWGYETINRWNANAIDPNRSFYQDSPADESRLLMQAIAQFNVPLLAHIDLHETTDTDNSEFRPALAARDAIEQKNWNIPDGFYLVADSDKPEPKFQQAIIESVEQVTHIAPADKNGQLIGAPLEQNGVINYAAKPLGLCMGLSDAKYVTTTEVYPDSPLVDDENCIIAQVAAITGGLDFIVNQK